MAPREWTYLVFGVVLLTALIFDLGLLSKKGEEVSIKHALFQTLFWVALGVLFGGFVWFVDSPFLALEYLSAYFMEWGLSIDNIFVFILLFAFFKIPENRANRLLLYGILLAVILRVIFITIGLVLIARFQWILYVFGLILLYTGIKMFSARQQKQFDPGKSIIYKTLKRVLPLTDKTESGRFVTREKGKRHYTIYFVVLVMLAGTDIVFALDSIPAVLAITRDKMVVYTSNVFAVLGLRSLFFLLKGAVTRFEYLNKGIAFVLIFIGSKMLVAYFNVDIHIGVSLAVILLCVGGAILFSINKNKRKKT